jgi:hypothetical protein
VQCLVWPKTELAAQRADDAGASGLQHLNRNTLPQTEFLQAVNLLGIA